MFSVKRFDAREAPHSESDASAASKREAVQARIAARAVAAGQGEAPAPPTAAAVERPKRAAPPAKAKTKAKQRYLKSKKERRKLKKSTGPKPFGQGKKKNKRDASDSVMETLERYEKRTRRSEDDAQLGKRAWEPEARTKVHRLDAQNRGVNASDGGSTMSDPSTESDESDDDDSSSPASEADEEAASAEGSLSDSQTDGAPIHDFHPSNSELAQSETQRSRDTETHGADAATSTRPSSAHEEPTHIDADSLQPHASDDTPDESALHGRDDESVLYRFPKPRRMHDVGGAALAQLGVPEGAADATLIDAALTEAVASVSAGDAARAESCGGVAVSRSVKRQLDRLGISEWFAVQAAVIPRLLNDNASRHPYTPHAPPRDLCVSAPTGSGKTLAYTVPIVETLHMRQLVQLRALVLVPTRDLAMQVLEMFEAIAKGSGLQTATITGNHSFRHEQTQLVRKTADDAAEYMSNVDILIATPGRLVDHIRDTPGFTLQHLRFLVIDEADRLLGQSFQQWVPVVLSALEPAHTDSLGAFPVLAPTWLDASDQEAAPWAADDLHRPAASVQKLLFSATLTRDPGKISSLKLRAPLYVTVRDNAGEDTAHGDAGTRFTTPASLREHMLITDSATKVLKLLSLMHHAKEGSAHLPLRQALCFAKSVDTAKRLVQLLAIFEDLWAREQNAKPLHVSYYSSELTGPQRAQMLRGFKQGDIDLLVCSDLISRGIDLPDVRHVISYDVPIDMAKYVHRVGRTARAGREGDAWTLVEEQEVYHFKHMLRDVAHLERVQTEKVPAAVTDRYAPTYKRALAELAHVYRQTNGAATIAT